MNITVGITSYNQSALLRVAIESVLGQTRQPAEIIIVDDASTDDSRPLIERYVNRYPDLIRPIFLNHNGGPNNARNQVIDAAGGEFLTFLDGDDRWLATKLEQEAKRLVMADQPDAVFSNFYFTDGAGNREFMWVSDSTPRPPEGHILPQVLALNLPRNTLFRSEIIPTRLWREAGYFDSSFTIYGDWDMRVRLAAAVGRFGYLDEPLCEYRRHGRGLSNKPIEMHLAAVDHIEQKYAGLISQLNETTRKSPIRGLDKFRAKLLRRAALDSLLLPSTPARKQAIRYYQQSLRFDRVLDFRLFWYLLKA